MKILYIGSLSEGQTSLERMRAMEALGHSTVGIGMERSLHIVLRVLSKLLQTVGAYPDFSRLNRDIRAAISAQQFDLVWVDKGTAVHPATLRFIKKRQPQCRLAHLNPDDPFGSYHKGWGLFLRGLPLYDVHFVARTPNVEEYRQRGASNAVVYDRSFSKTLHRPLTLSEADLAQYAAPVGMGFIGSHAPDRARCIAYLIQSGIPVAVYGNGWEGKECWDLIRPHFRSKALMGEEYVKAINGMGIALHFLRHENRDEQDSRTFELPACGACMIAERSPKHEAFFKENEEAVFFDNSEELLEKVRYHLAHPDVARRIGAAGRRRSVESGYDHESRMKQLLDLVSIENQEDVR